MSFSEDTVPETFHGDELALMIRQSALSLGYTNCGIINIEAVAGYADRLRERGAGVRFGLFQGLPFKKLSKPQKKYKWAKSIIVALNDTSCYNLPEALNGVIGKDYLFDGRMDAQSDAYQRRTAFEGFLAGAGVRFVNDPKHGVTALRFAAAKAGLGIIRKNNFLYTENGSGVMIEAWLIDRELTLIDTVRLPKCPERCGKCMDACPTKALCAPYTTSMFDCVSFLTGMAADMGLEFFSARQRNKFGGWVYGCDACQSACPFNAGKQAGGRDFPGVGELASDLLPEKIMELSYEEIVEKFASKFWYISPRNAWKWKMNALAAMENTYSDKYKKPVRLGLTDRDRRVRRYAKAICSRTGLL